MPLSLVTLHLRLCSWTSFSLLKASVINVEASPFGNAFGSCLVYVLLPLGRSQDLHCLPASLRGEISYLFLSPGFSDSADRNHARE